MKTNVSCLYHIKIRLKIKIKNKRRFTSDRQTKHKQRARGEAINRKRGHIRRLRASTKYISVAQWQQQNGLARNQNHHRSRRTPVFRPFHKNRNINTFTLIQKHFRCTIPGPASSYSSAVIHISWKELRSDKMLPPIHTEYLRSGGATTFTFTDAGANAVSSFERRASMCGNIVVPPLSTAFSYKLRRISTSQPIIESNASR